MVFASHKHVIINRKGNNRMTKANSIVILFAIFAIVLASGFLSSTVSADPLNLSDTVRQSGQSGSASPFPITDPSHPWDFTGQDFYALASIDTITITVTIKDGDTASWEFDYNNLSLGLDGFDTGLKLNWYRNDRTDTRTLTVTDFDNSINILSALKQDGQLHGTVIDSDSPGNNWIYVPFQSTYYTTLKIQGTPIAHTPEPASMFLFGSGLIALAGFGRKFKKG